MSKRETHIYHQSVSSTLNLSFDEMLKLANNLKKSTLGYIQKNGYACIVLISICCIDRKLAKVKVGFRGKKSIIKKRGHEDCDPTINPHLHIVTFANPGETISKYIHQYIEDALKGKYVWSTHAHQEKSWKTYLRYDFEQAMKNRTFCHNVDDLPQDRVEEFLDYCEFLNLSRNDNKPLFQGVSNQYFNKYHNRKVDVKNEVFTLLEDNETEKALITRGFDTTAEDTNYYNVIYSNNKYNNLYMPDNSNYPTISFFITNKPQTHQSNTS